jgi:hypothetical protein
MEALGHSQIFWSATASSIGLFPSSSPLAGYTKSSSVPFAPALPLPAWSRTRRNTTLSDDTTKAPMLDSPGAAAFAASIRKSSMRSAVTFSTRSASAVVVDSWLFALVE